jgi:hypothetical protein
MLRSRELSSTWATLDDPSRVTASYISTMPDCGHTVKSLGWVEGSAINQIMPRGAFPSREITRASRSLWASWRRSDMGANASTPPGQGVRLRHASWSEAGCGEWHDMTPMLLPHLAGHVVEDLPQGANPPGLVGRNREVLLLAGGILTGPGVPASRDGGGSGVAPRRDRSGSCAGPVGPILRFLDHEKDVLQDAPMSPAWQWWAGC